MTRLTYAIATLLALSGCNAAPEDPNSLTARWERAQLVKTCSNGDIVGREPNGGLLLGRPADLLHGSMIVPVARGVTTDEVCK